MFSALVQSKLEQAAKVYKTTQFSSVAAAADEGNCLIFAWSVAIHENPTAIQDYYYLDI